MRCIGFCFVELKSKADALNKARMELADPCRWYLIKFANEFGLYDGPDPETEFGSELTGIEARFKKKFKFRTAAHFGNDRPS